MANEKFILSQNIEMYPSAYRGKKNNNVFDPSSYLNTEKNLTGLVKRFTEGFVSKASGTKVEISLAGYWFKLDLANVPAFSQDADLWASIRTADITVNPETTNEYTITNLIGYDDGAGQNPNHILDYLMEGEGGEQVYKFAGIAFFTTEPSIDEYKYKLKVWDGETRRVPSTSFFKFKASEIMNDGKGADGTKSLIDEITLSTLKVDNTTDGVSAVERDINGKLISVPFSTLRNQLDLDTDDSPTFVSVKLSSSKIKDANNFEFTIPDQQLASTNDVTFKSIKSTDNKILRNNGAEITLPDSAGKLATVDYNSSTNTLTIKTN